MKFLKPEEYLPQVNALYAQLRERLTRHLPVAEIEHIGSSAIRGALSKGDLDVLVRVAREHFSDSLEKIQQLGFSVKKDTLRTNSLCMLEAIDTNGVAIQLIEKGSEFEMFVKFRDLLNSDSRLVERYNRLKTDSVGLSAEEYRQQKSKFIRALLGLSEE